MDALGSLLAGAFVAFIATALGSANLALIGRFSNKTKIAIIGFAAGVMSFSSYEMLLVSIQSSDVATAAIGFLGGSALLFLLEKLVLGKKYPSEHKKAIKLAGAITLHNIPEGFAIGSSFASSSSLGWLVALSIAVQDFPEGLMVAAPIAALGIRKKTAIFWGIFSGAVEAFSAIFGFLLLSTVSAIIHAALAFSAGAMIHVVVVEMLPEGAKDWPLMLGFFAFGILSGSLIASFLS
ncbi:MAG: ZIP family metal transporter [Candidatus Micrarchaeota archaeon]|nr:ZIP family metal transporter [Candidatus Micrarchaeota archaeon]